MKSHVPGGKVFESRGSLARPDPRELTRPGKTRGCYPFRTAPAFLGASHLALDVGYILQ